MRAIGNVGPAIILRCAALLVALLLGASAPATVLAAKNNDYPTTTIADYVFGCMASNGQTRPALEKCSCSIDVIASLLDHKQYVEAETILSMRLVGGEKSSTFRSAAWMKEAVARLKRAQAEAEVRCF